LFFDQEKGEAFAVEVMELFYYNESFDGDHKRLAQKIWDVKGKINDEKCRLLITLKMSIKEFNISEFAREVGCFDWRVEAVRFGIYSSV
jgi:hypothetical protein